MPAAGMAELCCLEILGMLGAKASAVFSCDRRDASWCHAKSIVWFRGTPRWFPLTVGAGELCRGTSSTPRPARPFLSAGKAGKVFCDPP